MTPPAGLPRTPPISQTGPDSKFIAYSAEMKKAFDTNKKDLVLQVGAARTGATATRASPSSRKCV